MKYIVLAVAFCSACTTLGPMPTTTGLSAMPIGRPGVSAQVGVVPGFYASQSAQNETKGAPIKQFSALFDPDRWLPVKGVIVGARIFGESGDTPGEPYLGYRRRIDDGLAVGAVVFGSTKRTESKLASYHGVRAGGEAAVDLRVWAPSRSIEMHAQAAASVTRILASGRYCVDTMGIAKDCDETNTAANTFINAKTVGVYPAATWTLALDVGRRQGAFDHLRVAALAGVGRMPLVENGEEAGTGTFFTIGLSLAVGLGLAD